jgi:hypothetical protein
MRKPTKKSSRQIGKSPALAAGYGKDKPGKPVGPEPVKLTADQKRQIKASKAIDALVNRADLYTNAVLRETEHSVRTGIAKDSHVARTTDARARMLDAVGKLRLIVCPEAAALKS